jgi:acetylornithine deacetylase/succinyl-diaminopimelate desuccinylase-like protein
MSLSSPNEQAPFYERPDELLQQLIRFNTTNPPGNERECVEWIDEVLRDGGYETKILAKDPERPTCSRGWRAVARRHRCSCMAM